MEQRILVGLTGASGLIYAERLIEFLLQAVPRVYLVATDAAKQVASHELLPKEKGFSLLRALEGEVDDRDKSTLRIFRQDDLFAPVASGSSVPTNMVVLPCSMGTLARIAQGLSGNLLERAADVVLKQKQQLILCPRETPLSSIHIRNMLTLSEMGVEMIPPIPAFYQKPQSIDDLVDFVVGRVLERLDIDHKLYRKWNSRLT
jgi:4-hydroxy-3-polyprenylbenzoate decarboxylase